MHHLKPMLKSHPNEAWMDEEMLSSCISENYSCAQSCTICADACLNENEVKELIKCIRLNLDCADVCETTGRMLSRMTSIDFRLLESQLDACITACRVCGDECNMHAAKHEHCRICAESCMKCADECKNMKKNVHATV